MANVQITQLPAAQPLNGSELVPIVQNGITVRTTTAAVAGSPAQQQTFLTLNQEPTLPNSRRLSGSSGITLTDGGAQGALTVSLIGAAASLNSASTGVIVKTNGNTVTGRTIQVTGAGLQITNGDGVAGNPVISLSGLPAQLAGFVGTGLVAVTNGTSLGGRQILGTANQINVANSDGGSGNPTISIVDNPVLPGTGGVKIPGGTQAQEPAGIPGQMRFNSDTQSFYGFAAGNWQEFSIATSSPGVTFFSAGTTGLTPAPFTDGAITLGGTLNAANGGTGHDTYATGDMLYASGATSLTKLGIGANASLLAVAGSAPAWQAPNTLAVGSLLDGGTNKIPYQTGVSTTSFIDAPTVSSTYLSWNGSNFVWAAVSGTGSVTSVDVSGGSTGLTTSGGPITVSGTITLGGTLNVSSGGTGANNLTGYVKGNGTSAMTASATVPTSDLFGTISNAQLANSSLTINGNSVSLGGSTTVTATATNALTIGAGLSGTSYNGSAPVTIAIDSSVVTLNGSQTLTNKTINGSSNTLSNIQNSSLVNSSVTIGSTSVALGATATTLAGLTSITVTQDPTSALQLATKQYVDAIGSNLNYHQSVDFASTAALPAYTYNNGTGGVGATITANANGALSFGGGSPTTTQRLLVKNEVGANEPYNGVYVVTDTGSPTTPFILTRATDYDSAGTGINEINAGDYFLVISGTNASTAWVQQTPLPITVGTTPIVFAQFNAPITYNAGTGLNLSPATTFNISNTGVTAATYGSASSVPAIAVNAQGQITSATDTAIAINGNQITSGTVGSSYISGSYTGITGVGTLTAGTWNAAAITTTYGGTGLTSYTAGDLVYYATGTALSKLSIGAAGDVLSSNGSIPQYVSQSSLSVGSATTATNVAGGTAGALPYQTGAGSTSMLSLGTSGQVLTAGASAPQYVNQSSLSVGSATTATNAVNVGITADSTNATNYLTFVSTTSGNLPQLVNSSITCNPSTGAITGGIAGGTF